MIIEIYANFWFVIYLTGSPTFGTPCTHNEVFADTLALFHSHSTVAALDDGNNSLLQLVCGGPWDSDSSVSPT